MGPGCGHQIKREAGKYRFIAHPYVKVRQKLQVSGSEISMSSLEELSLVSEDIALKATEGWKEIILYMKELDIRMRQRGNVTFSFVA